MAIEAYAGTTAIPDLGHLNLNIANTGLDGAFGKIPIAYHRLPAIGRLDVSVLAQETFELCLNCPGNQVTRTLPNQLVQRVIASHLWL